MFTSENMTQMTQEELKTSENLFGWDPTPGVVSVWANREGQAIIWQRLGEHIVSSRERFRPWLFATSLQDVAQLGPRQIHNFDTTGDTSTFTYIELNGPANPIPTSFLQVMAAY